ncbi:MAG: YeeE/YedE thiosulfate transporter family protein [Candidatus Krumholzibacteriota bacterium]|nr:YeeE/YedE thiosulfate transporter family protein [Candidatus Krumholzibacteriota bacterium]
MQTSKFMDKRKQTSVSKKDISPLLWGLAFGIAFGFLLQKGGATKYDVIVGQLLLTDFTVIKIMLSAVLIGMIGIHAMKTLGWVKLYPKSGSAGKNIIGGLIFGVGFAVLGYCPGTIAGAIGNGALDALVGGLAGILIGSGLFAALYPRLSQSIMMKGDFGDLTFPRLFKVNDWVIVIPAAALIIIVLYWLERAGL